MPGAYKRQDRTLQAANNNVATTFGGRTSLLVRVDAVIAWQRRFRKQKFDMLLFQYVLAGCIPDNFIAFRRVTGSGWFTFAGCLLVEPAKPF